MRSQVGIQIRRQADEAHEYTGTVLINDRQPIGTCVLVYVLGRHCVLTAGHVAREIRNARSPWWIAVGRNPLSRVKVESELLIWSENARDEEFETDLAIAWLHPVEVSALQRAPRTRFYCDDQVHKEHGPEVERVRREARCFFFLAGFQGELTDRLVGPGTNFATVCPQLKYVRTRTTRKGTFLDFLVADLNAEEEPMKWEGSDEPAGVRPRKKKGLDDLQGLSGGGVWKIDNVENRDGNFPMSLVGIAFLQREVPSGSSVNRHVTVLGRSAVMEYLEKVRPVQR